MGEALISQKAMAELAGVTRGAVCIASKPGKQLHPAMVRGKVNQLHPSAVAYIQNMSTQRKNRTYKVDPGDKAASGKTGSAAKAARVKASPPPAAPDMDAMDLLAVDIRALADKSLRELVGVFGTDIRFLDWLKALHEIEKVYDRRIKSAKAEGVLISRELVADYILDPINTLFERLMTDGAKTMAAEMYAMAEAKRTEKEFEEYVVDFIGSFVRALKPKLARALRSA